MQPMTLNTPITSELRWKHGGLAKGTFSTDPNIYNECNVELTQSPYFHIFTRKTMMSVLHTTGTLGSPGRQSDRFIRARGGMARGVGSAS